MSRRETICLHTDKQGKAWILQENGTPEKLAQFSSYVSLKPGTYRVIGVPENFWLIAELYSRLSRMVVESTLLVGAKTVCSNQSNVQDVLSCISTLEVHDSLFNCWHRMDNSLFNHYLLLSLNATKEKKGILHLYQNHCMRSVFNFLGMHSETIAVKFLKTIYDPRWYLNVKNPYNLSSFERMFGLKKSSSKAAKANFVLLNELKSNSKDSHFLSKKFLASKSNADQEFFENRQLLHFLVRNWLTTLGCQSYFNPEVFFSSKQDVENYRRKIGKEDA